jgi:hypothetical protein
MNGVRYLVGFALMLACAPKPAAPAEPVPPTSASADLPTEPIVAAPPIEPSAPVEISESPARSSDCTTEVCDDVADAIAKMKLFADQMCACKGQGKACAEGITAAMVLYGEMMAHKYEGKPEPALSDAQKQEFETAMKRLTQCTTEVMAG